MQKRTYFFAALASVTLTAAALCVYYFYRFNLFLFFAPAAVGALIGANIAGGASVTGGESTAGGANAGGGKKYSGAALLAIAVVVAVAAVFAGALIAVNYPQVVLLGHIKHTVWEIILQSMGAQARCC